MGDADSADMPARSRFGSFLRADHRYVFLGTSAVAAIGIWFGRMTHSSWSFLAKSYAVESVLYYLLVAWLIVSAVALVNKLLRWKGDAYAKTSPFKRPAAVRIERIGSYVVWAITLIFFIDRAIMGGAALIAESISQNSNPNEFLPSMVYMLYKMGGTFLTGIENTVIIAIVGTVVGFLLGLLFVFLRLQEPDRSDNDFIRFLKVVGSGFASVYSTVVRGTPMMIQGLLIYYAGTGLLSAQGMTPTQILTIWSPFNAGLVTVSLNSTAYMMEALRSGIGAVDAGQTEAARSLGLSQWQAMRKVVFPQGIKNAIPALSNELVVNIKDSSVLMAIGVVELTFAARTIAGVYFKQMEIYVASAVVYLILTMVASWLLTKFEHHFGVQSRVVLSTSDAPVPGTEEAEQ